MSINPSRRQNNEPVVADPSNQSSLLLPQTVDNMKVWDDAVIELERTGQATVVLRRRPRRPSSESERIRRPGSDGGGEEGDCSCCSDEIDDNCILDEAEKIHGRAFQVSRRVFDIVLKNKNTDTNDIVGDNAAKEEEEEEEEQEQEQESTSRTSISMKLLISPDADSAHVTGFHTSGALSSYNTHREGVVFSDGQLMPCTKDEWIDYFVEERGGDNNVDGLYDEMELSLHQMSNSLHTIASHTLRALERRLELPHGWFDDHCFERACENDDSKITSSPFRRQSATASSLGGIRKSSQWHIKRYTPPKLRKSIDTTTTTNTIRGKVEKIENAETENKDEGTTAPQILLEMHTDPSLISVVVHDRPGVQMGDAMGLQYYRPRKRISKSEMSSSSSPPKEEEQEEESEWIDCKGHGHAVATIFVGSILAYLTLNQWRGCKHRVVGSVVDDCERQQLQEGSRMAATLFVRPRQDFLMRPLPSPVLLSQAKHQHRQRQQKNQSKSKKKQPLTFNEWLKRVARNYEANKRTKE